MKTKEKTINHPNRKVMTIIILMTMTSIINNMAHPVTPKLVKEIGFNSFLYGLLFSAMALANFIFSPFWGRLSEVHGRKIFMLMSPFFYGFAQLGFGFSTNPYIIIGFRLLAGSIACATFVCGMAYLVDVTPIAERSRIMVIYTAVTGFGANIGYLLGGYIGNVDYHLAFIFQAIFSIFSTLIIFIFLKEVKDPNRTYVRNNLFKDLKKYQGTILPFMILMVILTSFVATGFNIGFNSYLNEILQFGPLQIGIVMAVTGVIGIITNVFIFPIIKRRFNDYYLLTMSIFSIATTLVLTTLFTHLNLRVIILIFFFTFLALYRPLLQSILSKSGNNNGEIMGFNNAANAIGMFTGSLYAGAMFAFNENLTFYSFAFISFIVGALLLRQKKKLEGYY